MLKNTIKKTLPFIIAVALATTLFLNTAAAPAGFGNFTYSGEYTAGQFSDVNVTDWFWQYVGDACNYGFFRGKSADVFDPGGLLTLGEAVTLAARLRSIYHTGSADFAETSPYYTAYAEYALEHGIIDSHGAYGEPATRARFAMLVYKALPPDAFPVLGAIPDYGICDVMPDADYGAAVYSLYRAGVISGSDRFGTFFPNSNITRAEASTIMVRIADPATRSIARLPSSIPAELIFQRSADAVFMIETFDRYGKSIRTGSGFFISDTGLAITVLHVFDTATSATITLYNGDTFPVWGIRAISREYNLAMFEIETDKGGFDYLNLADSSLIEEGNLVYALGSPRTLINSITEGVISKTSREIDGEQFIQFSAPISFGSGGSPVLNKLGQVVGIASSSFSYGQHLNLAVPANFIKELKPGWVISLVSLPEV